MRTAELDYFLPESLIAQHPCEQRSQSRLLVAGRIEARLEDRLFCELPQILERGSLLVANNTRVLPAKFYLRRKSGGRIEGLWIATHSEGTWEVLLRGARRLRAQEKLRFDSQDVEHEVTVTSPGKSGRYHLQIDPADSVQEILERVGMMPLPPYIKREDRSFEAQDRQRYQTLFASECGAVAAPTAGLHFDQQTTTALSASGIDIVHLTLHVGPGTFKPVEVEDLKDHHIHCEQYCVSAAAWQEIEQAKAQGRAIVAVGTTSARVLESVARNRPKQGNTDLFIYPPFRFKIVDGLITNFHLPRSTLLAMIYAFGGTTFMRNAYLHAIAARYRFYSYGDAMLIR